MNSKRLVMKCPDDGKLQAFIDGELTSGDSAIVFHLSSCSKCSERVDKQRKLASDFKRIMARDPSGFSEVPSFKIKRAKAYSAPLLAWELIAACSILLLLVLGPKYLKNTPPLNMPLIHGSSIDIDANKPITDQGTILLYIDDKGTVTEYVD